MEAINIDTLNQIYLSKNNFIISDMSEGNKFNMTIRPSDNRLSVSIGNTAKIEVEYNFGTHEITTKAVTTDGKLDEVKASF